MRLLYTILYTLAFLAVLPYFLVLGLIRGKYLKSAWQRFGWIPVRSDRPSCWIHSVSVGELLSARPVVKRIREQYPDLPLFISTTTMTGNKLARGLLPDRVFFFPFDWGWSVRRVLDRIRPRLILVMETEIWPHLLWQAEDRRIPVVLVNGRLSDRSYSRYRRVHHWIPDFRECWMQSPEDARRMEQLTDREVQVMGNLKFDFHPPALQPELRRLLAGWKGDSLLWVCGSTMPGEEAVIADAFAQLSGSQRFKLLIAPRHPERFEEVARLLASRGILFCRRSQLPFDPAARVMLLDSIGELAGCYEFSDIAFVGGTISSHGGHNPIEPAYFAKPVLAGPHYENFRAIFAEFLGRGALIVTSDLRKDVERLLTDTGLRERTGLAAGALVKENSGATEFVIQRIRKYIDDRDIVEPVSKLPV